MEEGTGKGSRVYTCKVGMGLNQGLEAQENWAQGGQDGECKVVRPI